MWRAQEAVTFPLRLWRFDSVPTHFLFHVSFPWLRGVAGSTAVPQTVGGGSKPPGAIQFGSAGSSAGALRINALIFEGVFRMTGSTGAVDSSSSSMGRAPGLDLGSCGFDSRLEPPDSQSGDGQWIGVETGRVPAGPGHVARRARRTRLVAADAHVGPATGTRPCNRADTGASRRRRRLRCLLRRGPGACGTRRSPST